ncbi:hypothetical protein P1P75_21540 [Streptomyces sp. ID05-39B]|uniref:hypothetical protein n=1 Tax=Streptomyces sp. ID05-39B TaxID=3028664 RepID=UPI0029AE546C|nr:hypothetical protein [Streptomyces sp. ID05-39B]MDX3528946.1 hypothetical protein [Streptomyces sp. ID05-39B]
MPFSALALADDLPPALLDRRNKAIGRRIRCPAGFGTQRGFRSPRPARGGPLSVGSGLPYAPDTVRNAAAEELLLQLTADQRPPPGFRVGLDFVGFQDGSDRVLRTLSRRDRSSGLDFGGQPGLDAPAGRLLSVRAGGTHPVPPARDASPCLSAEVFG